MDDLIRRGDVIEVVERLRDKFGNDEMGFALNWAVQSVRRIKAVDDVEVVRCRDCVHSSVNGSYESLQQAETHLNCRCFIKSSSHKTLIVAKDGYCAWGQRREDGDT